jgi:hypothetical protein
MKTTNSTKMTSVDRYSVLLLCLVLPGVAQAQSNSPKPNWRPFETVDNDFQWLQKRINEACGPSDTSGIEVEIANGTTPAHNYSITLRCRQDRTYTHWIVDSRVTSATSYGKDDVDGVSKDLGVIYGLQGNTIIRVRKQDER